MVTFKKGGKKLRLEIIIIIVIFLISAIFCLNNVDTELIKNEDSNIHNKSHNGMEFIPIFTILIIFTIGLIINRLQEKQQKKKR